MALNGLRLLYYFFLSLFGNTGLTPLDVAGGRTSSTGTPSASAEASTPTVRHMFRKPRVPFSASIASICLLISVCNGESNDMSHCRS